MLSPLLLLAVKFCLLIPAGYYFITFDLLRCKFSNFPGNELEITHFNIVLIQVVWSEKTDFIYRLCDHIYDFFSPPSPQKPYKPVYSPPPIPKSLSDYAYLYQKDLNYVNDWRLTRVAPDFYANQVLESTLKQSSKMIEANDLEVHFFPLDQDTMQQYQYIHGCSIKSQKSLKENLV